MEFHEAIAAARADFEMRKQLILARADEVAVELNELLPEDMRAAGIHFAFELSDPM